MSVVVKCPFCSKEVTILEEHAGQQLNCPYCQQIFIAPSAEQLQAASATQNTPPPPAAGQQLNIAQQPQTQNAAQSAPPRILSLMKVTVGIGKILTVSIKKYPQKSHNFVKVVFFDIV